MQTMNQEEIGAVLALEHLGRLGLVDGDRPYVVPIPFIYWQGSVYLPFRLGGRKHEVMCNNPRACFEVDWSARDLHDYASVLMEGCLQDVVNEEEEGRVVTGFQEKYEDQEHPITPLAKDAKPLALGADAKIVRLEVATMSGLKADGESLDWVPLLRG